MQASRGSERASSAGSTGPTHALCWRRGIRSRRATPRCGSIEQRAVGQRWECRPTGSTSRATQCPRLRHARGRHDGRGRGRDGQAGNTTKSGRVATPAHRSQCTAKVVWFRGRRTSLACRRPGHSSLRVDHVRRRSSSSACAGIPRRSHLRGGCRRTRALATSRPAERQRRWHAASAVRAARTTTCSAGRAPCGSTRSRACRRSSTPSGSPRCHEPSR